MYNLRVPKELEKHIQQENDIFHLIINNKKYNLEKIEVIDVEFKEIKNGAN